MKVLFCTSEALPFAASGGLGDVAGSLPQALRQRLIGCRIVMPMYEDIPQRLRDNMRSLPACLCRSAGEGSTAACLKPGTAA